VSCQTPSGALLDARPEHTTRPGFLGRLQRERNGLVAATGEASPEVRRFRRFVDPSLENPVAISLEPLDQLPFGAGFALNQDVSCSAVRERDRPVAGLDSARLVHHV
jgi:hypothetical protein